MMARSQDPQVCASEATAPVGLGTRIFLLTKK